MKVLMISTDRKLFEKGSVVSSRISEYGKLVEELHVIVFSTKRHGLREISTVGNVTIYPTNVYMRALYLYKAYKIGKLILNKSADSKWLISTQDPFETGLVGVHLKKKFKTNLQVQLHGDFLNQLFIKDSKWNGLRLYFMNYVLEVADCVRVVSKRIKHSIEDKYKFVDKCMLLPIYTDLKIYEDAEPTFSMKEMYPQFTFISLMVSRLENVKNITLAIKAFKKVATIHKGAGLVIVGNGSDKARLHELVKEEGLGEKVIFVGWQDDIVSYFKGADLFINTSNHEGYCLSLVEAAASMCPIVTTDVGIVGEALNESNVFVCSVGDIECFENKIINAVNNPELLEKMAKKAKNSLEEHTGTKEEYLVSYRNSFEACINKTQKI